MSPLLLWKWISPVLPTGEQGAVSCLLPQREAAAAPTGAASAGHIKGDMELMAFGMALMAFGVAPGAPWKQCLTQGHSAGCRGVCSGLCCLWSHKAGSQGLFVRAGLWPSCMASCPSVSSSHVPVREFLCTFPLPVLPSHRFLSDSVVASSACQLVCLVHVRECSVHTYGFILKVCSFLF